jgi:hypothetical protein
MHSYISKIRCLWAGWEGRYQVLQGLALDFAQPECRRLTSATDAIALPEPKPRAVGELIIVSSIRSREVAFSQRSAIGHREDALQLLDFGWSV